MQRVNQVRKIMCRGLPWLALMVLSCSPVAVLKVHYQMPPAPPELSGKGVFLTVEDGRENKAILGPGARGKFGTFAGNLSFSVARYQESGFKIGVFQPAQLLRQAFKHRLKSAGAKLLSAPGPDAPQLELVLKDFLLDREESMWISKVAYEARVLSRGKLLYSQQISGQGERYGILGKEPADRVLSEIFSEALNRLDLVSLLQRAAEAQE